MKVTLYRYIGDSDTANKLLKSNTVVYDKEVIPYGSFDPAGATFRLDVLLDVNYAKFTYNSHDYYGYVDVSTDSKGIYSYKITTDPLTTAWYAGCFNTTGNVCKYSDSGDNLLFDDRAVYKEGKERLFFPLSSLRQPLSIVVACRDFTPEVSNTTVYPTTTTCYVFESLDDFKKFIKIIYKLPDADQNKYIPSILGFYLVPTLTLPTNLGDYGGNNIYLCARAGKTITSENELFKRIEDQDIVYLTKTITNAKNNYEDVTKEVSSSIYFPLTSIRQNAIFKVHVANCGDFTFKYSDVSKNQDITSLGYRVAYDFQGGTQLMYLTVNGVTQPDYYLRAPIPLSFPINYDSSVQRFDQLTTGLFSSAVNFVTSVATMNPLTVASTFQNMFNIGKNAVNQALDFKFDYENGAQSSVGSIGNSAELQAGLGSNIVVTQLISHNLQDIQDKFGKPDGRVRFVGNLKGWVQTEFCHLPSNGLPFDLISQAEKLSDAGFRIEE